MCLSKGTDELAVCPECKEQSLEKRYSTLGVVLCIGGWIYCGLGVFLCRRLKRGHCPRCYKSQFDIDAAERRRRQCYVDDRSLRSASDDDDWTKEDDSDLVIVKQAPVNV